MRQNRAAIGPFRHGRAFVPCNAGILVARQCMLTELYCKMLFKCTYHVSLPWEKPHGTERGKSYEYYSQYGKKKTVVTISHNADYFFRMAHQAMHAGDHLHALDCLDRALSTDPHFAGAWHEKGNCLDELGRYTDALACYDEALKLDPYDAESWYNKGLVLRRIGRESEAYACINRGIDLALGR